LLACEEAGAGAGAGAGADVVAGAGVEAGADVGAAEAGAAFAAAACSALSSTSPTLPDLMTGTAHPQPLWVCVEPWVVVAVFVAFADEAALFDWVTAPFVPGLPMRTEMFSFVGAICTALDAAMAAWFVDDDCVDD
jgi:hypothetical protein